jgi:hypothetical protein
MKKALALATLLLVATAATAQDGADHKATYERLKQLAGTWSGRMDDPVAGPPISVRYEVVSGGNAVIEYQNPGRNGEMVTVYYLANGQLQASHYCAAGNQPAYRLGKGSTHDLAVMEFAGGTGFDPEKDGYVRHGDIRFVAPDRIEERWFHFVGPKQMGATHWFLQREVTAAAAPAAALPAK